MHKKSAYICICRFFFVSLQRIESKPYKYAKKGGLMLGVKSRRKPITGEFAQNLRDQIRRYETEQLNEEDRKRIAFLDQPREHEVIWE